MSIRQPGQQIEISPSLAKQQWMSQNLVQATENWAEEPQYDMEPERQSPKHQTGRSTWSPLNQVSNKANADCGGSVSEYSDEDRPKEDSQSHGEQSLHEENATELILPPSEYNRARAAMMSCSVVSDPSEYRFNPGRGAPWVARSSRGRTEGPDVASMATGSQFAFVTPARGAQTLGFAGLTSVSTLDHRARPAAAKYASSELMDRDQFNTKERRIGNHNWSAQLSYQMSLGGSGRFDQVSQNHAFESRGKLDEQNDVGDDDIGEDMRHQPAKQGLASKFRSINFQNERGRAFKDGEAVTGNKKYPSWYVLEPSMMQNQLAPPSSFGIPRGAASHQDYKSMQPTKEGTLSSRFKSAKFGSTAYNHFESEQDHYDYGEYKGLNSPQRRGDPTVTLSTPSFRDSGYMGALPPSVAEGSMEDRSMGTSNSQSKGATSGSTGKRTQTLLTAQEVQKLQSELAGLNPLDFEEAEKIIPRLESRMHIFLIDQNGTEMLHQILTSSRLL